MMMTTIILAKKLQYKDPHIIWCEHDEDDMSKVAYDILNKAGCFDGIYKTLKRESPRF